MPVSVVTGGAGFIGSFMVDLLMEKGHEVRVIDNFEKGPTTWLDRYANNANCTLVDDDITLVDTDDTVFQGMDYLFHFGGLPEKMPSFTEPYRYHEVNGMGTVNLLEICRKRGVRKFVYAMTSAIYGEIPEGATHGSREDDPVSFETPYALSKYIGECALMSYYKTFDVPGVSIRIINAFGPRVRAASEGGALFHVFFKAMAEGKPLPILGTGEQLRDFIYVTDICEAFLLCAESPYRGEIYNLGGGNPRSVMSIAKLLGHPVEHKPMRGHEPFVTWSDNTKLTIHTGWVPTSDFELRVKDMAADLGAWQ
jgi:UDP-glucose 4-epimerase